ncbi:Pleckstrin homology-like domain family B member 1 [Clarias magur]|uniref:Pleckstrin homology-like domain family B member 1 n=1 Tax=Clarias magur TaxID=1594786 RepID=A0A8J4UK78_CLAMG|nr:Pleckstrin homology-like domain family B member 1 [Clarias magur]
MPWSPENADGNENAGSKKVRVQTSLNSSITSLSAGRRLDSCSALHFSQCFTAFTFREPRSFEVDAVFVVELFLARTFLSLSVQHVLLSMGQGTAAVSMGPRLAPENLFIKNCRGTLSPGDVPTQHLSLSASSSPLHTR